jgi:glycosyltransferase involved in cell wall biosynthesis
VPKILRIINRLNLGGPTYNAAYLTRYLAPEYETMLVSGMKDESEESSEFIVKKLGIEPVYIPEMKREIDPGNDRSAYIKLKGIIRDFKPDIVHTHASKAGTIGRIAAINSGISVIVHTFHGHAFHSYFNPFTTRIFMEIERYLARRSTAIIAISEIQRQELVYKYKIVADDKVTVIPLGFDLSRFREQQQENRKKFRDKYQLTDEVVIGIIGRLVPIKNHEMFVSAFKKLMEQTQRKVKAFIIGDGINRAYLQKRIRDSGLENNVVFTSWQKDIEIAMAGLDIVALTSLNEGTPVSLIEAQAAGKPVISTEVGGVANVVLRDKTGFLSPANDVNAFAESLMKLTEDEHLRDEMGARGWNFVKDQFHYKRLVEDSSSLYSRLLGNFCLPKELAKSN